ncbi:MAG TPA: divergent polysaccharide deacetylase family protein [Methyloceanibacter sp.]|nr:divergent polysaccharide deacetylase family protein [Methyloceanibacter sp.]
MKALVVAASIVFFVLCLGVAGLAYFPDPDAGEPVVVLDVAVPAGGSLPPAEAEGQAEPAPAPPSSAEAPAVPAPAEAGANGDAALPPGFAVDPASPVPPLPEGLPQSAPGAAPSTPTQQAMLDAPTAAIAALASGDAGALGAMPDDAARVAALVEQSQYGPLPKVGADGKRPSEVYAAQSRYAGKVAPGEPARVAILVEGIGVPDGVTMDAIKGLPASFSVACGAYGRNLQEWILKARDAGHEVLLEIPLEPENYPTTDPGPHTLLTTLPPEENVKRLQWLMSRYTGYVGVTNHMGAKFEATQASLAPVLEEVKSRGLLYLDDGSVQGSTAGQIASSIGLDYSVANVQIDGDIAKGLAELETLAKQNGAAIGVATAKPATVKQLAEWAEKLEAKGIVLVPVSAAMRAQRQI